MTNSEGHRDDAYLVLSETQNPFARVNKMFVHKRICRHQELPIHEQRALNGIGRAIVDSSLCLSQYTIEYLGLRVFFMAGYEGETLR